MKDNYRKEHYKKRKVEAYVWLIFWIVFLIGLNMAIAFSAA